MCGHCWQYSRTYRGGGIDPAATDPPDPPCGEEDSSIGGRKAWTRCRLVLSHAEERQDEAVVVLDHVVHFAGDRNDGLEHLTAAVDLLLAEAEAI